MDVLEQDIHMNITTIVDDHTYILYDFYYINNIYNKPSLHTMMDCYGECMSTSGFGSTIGSINLMVITRKSTFGSSMTWGFPEIGGTPIAGWFIGEIPSKVHDDWGYPHVRKLPHGLIINDSQDP